MTRYRVHAHRAGDWWALEFPDADARIHSQARRLEQIPAVAADAISFSLDVVVDPDDIIVEPILDERLVVAVSAARDRRIASESASRAASEATRSAIRTALSAGLSMRDVGELVGVSFQYVSQVAKGSPPAAQAS